MAVIDFDARAQVFQADPTPNRLNEILRCSSFRLHQVTVTKELPLPPLDTFAAGTLIAGRVLLTAGNAALELTRGDSFVVPAGMPSRLRWGHCQAVITTPCGGLAG